MFDFRGFNDELERVMAKQCASNSYIYSPQCRKLYDKIKSYANKLIVTDRDSKDFVFSITILSYLRQSTTCTEVHYLCHPSWSVYFSLHVSVTTALVVLFSELENSQCFRILGG